MQLFDAHFHIIEPNYPLIKNNGFLPNYYSIKEYLKEMDQLNLEPIGGAIVSGSFQGYDQSYLFHVLSQLPATFVGVAQVPATISIEELKKLNHSGVRAIRFNLYRGMIRSDRELSELSVYVYETFGWHTEFYLDGAKIPELLPLLSKIPVFTIDHLGMNRLSKESLEILVELNCYFKVSGFGRISFEPLSFIKTVMDRRSDRLIFGTDLPGTRARRKYQTLDMELLEMNFSKTALKKILMENALKLYQKR